MAETPPTAAVVVDYLKEEFPGAEVPSVPEAINATDMFRFSVVSQDSKRYWLEVSEECLEDLSDSEITHKLRAHRTAATMRSAATNTAVLTKIGIFSNRVPPT